MDTPIRPIETRYSGCRFRSRLEARWAVFFDHLGIRWEYEPQGYAVKSRAYLPDFRLPDADVWIEVKGDENAVDRGRIEDSALHLPGRGLILLGPIPDPDRLGAQEDWAWQLFFRTGETPDDVWADWIGFTSEGTLRPVRETSCAAPFACDDETPWLEPVVGDTTGPSSSAAYRAARSARFEHGEQR